MIKIVGNGKIFTTLFFWVKIVKGILFGVDNTCTPSFDEFLPDLTFNQSGA